MSDIAIRRLSTQRLVGEPFASAVDAVAWLGAVQSQDYAGAKWALGQRTSNVADADLDLLFDRGAILRTHVMRPTWHFVLPDDIRWLLDLTGPRVKATLAHYGRQLGVEPDLLSRAYSVIEASLRDGTSLTRQELAQALKRAGVSLPGQGLGHILMQAELDGIIASGPRRGKQFTYALLGERAPLARKRGREEALAELTRRFFTGRGPAQVADFAWWSGLTVAEARRGLALVGESLVHEVIDGKTYWRAPDVPHSEQQGPFVHLLPNYDEFLIAYRDRSASLDPARGFDTAPFPYGSILAHTVLLDGQVWGGWKRRAVSGGVEVELGPLDRLDETAAAELRRAAERLSRFLGTPVTLVGLPPD